MRQIELPQSAGPWTWRTFHNRDAAVGFLARHGVEHLPLVRLAEEHVAPDGHLLPPGTWIVLYKPIIFD